MVQKSLMSMYSKNALLILLLFGAYLLLSVGIVSSAAAVHPSFFFSEGDILSLRNQAVTTHKSIWQPIQAYAAIALDLPPLETAPADADVDAYRQFGDRLIPIAFACVIEDSLEFCDNAKHYLLTYAQWEQWGEENQRGLGLAHMVLGVAIAYDWLYPYLTPDERSLVSDNLGLWADRLYEASVSERRDEWNNWWSNSYMQNHYVTIHSALGSVALILQNENRRSLLWLDQAIYKLSITQELLEGIGDGSWHESITYQSYLLSMMLPFLVNLDAQQNFDIIPHNYLENYTYWRLYNHIPGTFNTIFSYGDTEIDWGNSRMPQNILRYIAGAYNDGYAEWMAQQLIVADGRSANLNSVQWYVYEFLYYKPEQLLLTPTELPLGIVFPDFEGVVWRSSWQSDAIVFGFKTGAYGGRFAYEGFTDRRFPWGSDCDCQLNIGHDHQDVNSFTLTAGREWLIPEAVGVDLGDASYHNTLLIDGMGQYLPPPEHFDAFSEDFINSDGQLIRSILGSEYAYLLSDATRRYHHIADLELYNRIVLRIPNNNFIIVDKMVAETRHRYESTIHFGGELLQIENWFLTQTRSGNTIAMQTIFPLDPSHIVGRDVHPYVRTVSEADNAVIAQLLYLPNVNTTLGFPEITLLFSNDSVLAFRLNRQSETLDIMLNLDFEVTPNAFNADVLDINTQRQIVGNYAYDGLMLAIQTNKNGMITGLFSYGNTMIEEQNSQRVLARGMDLDEPLEVKLNDTMLEVHGHFSNPIEIYAPTVSEVYLNGSEIDFQRLEDYIIIVDE